MVKEEGDGGVKVSMVIANLGRLENSGYNAARR